MPRWRDKVKTGRQFWLWMGGTTALAVVLTPSTFAEEWSPRRTAGRAVARVVFREIGILLRDRGRHSRPSPERWPESPRPRRRPGGRADDLVIPIAGVRWEDLRDSFGDPRSGGRRHRGIDIFAPRWAEVVAATSGTLTAIGYGGLAGRSLWLVGDDGRSYFYGHLEAWPADVRDGMEVVPGELIGYVGNSGNAAGLPTHLHFEVHEDGRALNPYAVLANASPVYGDGRMASRRSSRVRG